jgi:hypothetical protein
VIIRAVLPSVYVEARADGVHVRWTDPRVHPAPGVVPMSARTLGIRLDDVSDGVPGPAGLLQLRAFAAAHGGCPDGSATALDPRRGRDLWVRRLSAGGEFPPSAQPLLDDALARILRDHQVSVDRALAAVRIQLREAVIEAHRNLPTEEIEQIVRDAVAEFVMAQ